MSDEVGTVSLGIVTVVEEEKPPQQPEPISVGSDERSAAGGRRTGLPSIIAMSVAFFVLFSSYNIVQDLQSQVNRSVGFASLGIINLTFAITSLLVAPVVVRVIGEPISMSIGAVCFAAFAAANIRARPVAMYATAFIDGIGDSLVWVASGTYLNRSSSVFGKGALFSTIFVTSFATSGFTANLIAALVQVFALRRGSAANGASVSSSDSSPMPSNGQTVSFFGLFIACTVVCGAASLLFLLVAPLKVAKGKSEDEQTSSSSSSPSPSSSGRTKEFRDSIVQLLSMFRRPHFVVLIPLFFSFGCEIAFIFGNFTSMIADTVESSWALTITASSHVVFSFLFPHCSHWLRGQFLWAPSFLSTGSALLLACFATSSHPHNRGMVFGAAALMGMMEASKDVGVLMLLIRDYPESQHASCNSAFRFFQALGFSFTFFISVGVSNVVVACIVGALHVAGLVLCIVRVAVLFRPKESKNLLTTDSTAQITKQ